MPGNKSAKGMAPENVTSLWRNARLATFNPSMEGIGAIENAAIAVRNGRIVLPDLRAICPPMWPRQTRQTTAAVAGSLRP